LLFTIATLHLVLPLTPVAIQKMTITQANKWMEISQQETQRYHLNPTYKCHCSSLCPLGIAFTHGWKSPLTSWNNWHMHVKWSGWPSFGWQSLSSTCKSRWLNWCSLSLAYLCPWFSLPLQSTARSITHYIQAYILAHYLPATGTTHHRTLIK
jgi:hypothetical protein